MKSCTNCRRYLNNWFIISNYKEKLKKGIIKESLGKCSRWHSPDNCKDYDEKDLPDLLPEWKNTIRTLLDLKKYKQLMKIVKETK